MSTAELEEIKAMLAEIDRDAKESDEAVADQKRSLLEATQRLNELLARAERVQRRLASVA